MTRLACRSPALSAAAIPMLKVVPILLNLRELLVSRGIRWIKRKAAFEVFLGLDKMIIRLLFEISRGQTKPQER